MYEYTYKNHFKFGYQLNSIECFFSERQSPKDVFIASYGSCVDKNLTWKEANLKAARLIHERKDGDIWLLLSGGMDSEICLRSFLDQKLPIRTVSLVYKNQQNHEELFFIKKIISEYSLKHEYIEINLESFLESKEFLDTVDFVKCVSPIVGCHLWLANQLPGTPIIAQGEVHLKKTMSDGYVPGVSPYLPSSWSLVESERLCSIYMNFIKRARPAIPGFFQYLPEQTYSFLTKNPYLEKLVSNQIVGKLGTRTSKNIMLHQFYPEIEMRTKYDGWENMRSLHDRYRDFLAQRFLNSDNYYRINLDQLIAQLGKKNDI